MSSLTPRQTEILAAIRSHWADHGCSPTYRELCEVLGVGSPNGVAAQLKAIARKGAVELAKGSKARCIWPAGMRDGIRALARQTV